MADCVGYLGLEGIGWREIVGFQTRFVGLYPEALTL